MNRRATLTLAFTPIVLLSLLLFLGQAVVVSGDGSKNLLFGLPGAPLLQGATEIEPNDTIDTANPIDVNLTMAGTIPIAQTGDIDWYRLTFPDTDLGREYRATLEEVLPDADYKLELNLYDSDGSLVDSQSGGSVTTVDWTAGMTTYYLRVRAIEFDVANAPGDADYELTVLRFAAAPTPTYTATPVPWDDCEINDSLGTPCLLAVGFEKDGLNFVNADGQPVPNDDYFAFLAKTGRAYRITTIVSGGADTHMWLYSPTDSELAYDDDGGVGSGSRIERSLNEGWYKILVRDRTENQFPSTEQTYSILVEDVTPGPTATSLPGTVTATPKPVIPGQPDAFEPNYDFGRATLIGLATKYTNLNFVPWTGVGQDNDFYKLWVVAGKLYTCESTDLGAATNTNMIICSGPSWEQCFAGNDDVEPFDPDDPYRSRLTFFSSYNGYLYLVLGQVGADRILPEEWARLDYSLQCYIEQPGTATPTPTSQFVPPTPQPTAIPGTPVPSPTLVRLVVVPMTTPERPSLPEPAGTPTPELYVIEVLFYYDRDNNGQMDAGEGIMDVLVRAFDAISGELLSIDYTDETGFLRFTVPGKGPVRVSVPFFGFDQIATATNTSIQIRIAPRP
jgi:hypothetical protein